MFFSSYLRRFLCSCLLALSSCSASCVPETICLTYPATVSKNSTIIMSRQLASLLYIMLCCGYCNASRNFLSTLKHAGIWRRLAIQAPRRVSNEGEQMGKSVEILGTHSRKARQTVERLEDLPYRKGNTTGLCSCCYCALITRQATCAPDVLGSPPNVYYGAPRVECGMHAGQ